MIVNLKQVQVHTPKKEDPLQQAVVLYIISFASKWLTDYCIQIVDCTTLAYASNNCAVNIFCQLIVNLVISEF